MGALKLKYQTNLHVVYQNKNYRKKTTLQEGGTTINTRIFAGNYEKEILEDGTIKEYHYISGPTGLIAIYIITNGTGHLYYTATDHLGSICQILEPNGTVVEQTNYDPWGRIRNENWEYEANLTGLTLIPRGYTGHEHLQHFALINMNGRMYDPVLGRMLSPDNYVQDPSNAQNYNRYAYVLNNPLKYTDPSGELLFFLIPVAIGAIVGAEIGGAWASGWKKWNPLKWNKHEWKGAGVGAMVGAAVGLGVSAGLSVAGANITGISATGAPGYAVFSNTTSASTTFLWDVTSNALITSSVNIGSAYMQGYNTDYAFKSGVVGLLSGSIGGAFGSWLNPAKRLPMQAKTINWQNYITAGINGGGSRYIYGSEQGKKGWDLAQYTGLGITEGLLSANLSSKLFKYNIINKISGRYITSSLTQAITSIPGAGFSAYSYYITGLAGIGGYYQAGIAGGIIGASGFSAATANLYHSITPDDYQANPYFTPFGNFWK